MVTLRRELTALISNVHLNRSGWWLEALRHLFLSILWEAGTALTLIEIADFTRNRFGRELDNELLDQISAKLIADGLITLTPNNKLALSDAGSTAIRTRLDEFEATEESVAGEFVSALERHHVAVPKESTWSFFYSEMLLPLIKEMGARAFNLLSNQAGEVAHTITLRNFLDQYPDDVAARLRNAIIDFLDPARQPVRSYLLGLLNSYLLMDSIALDSDTLNALSRVAETRPRFDLFLDTNFLFSVLNLHDNPSNEAALALMRLIEKAKPHVDVTLSALTITLDEAKRAITGAMRVVEDRPLPKRVAEGLLDTDVSGIVRRFASVSTRQRDLRPSDFFRPYQLDLRTIVESNNVSVVDEDVSAYQEDRRVRAALEEQRELRSLGLGDKRPKTMAAVTHDVLFWHIVTDKRTREVSSPIDARVWIVTVDFRLIRYDEQRSTPISEHVPLCVHPTTILQLLQFWVPRTSEFEEAILASLRLPFLISASDASSEQLTLRILSLLTRYERVGDLSSGVVTRILMNDALRARLVRTASDDAGQKLVESALAEDLARVSGELEETKRRLSDAERLARIRSEVSTTSHQPGRAERQARYRQQQRSRKAAAPTPVRAEPPASQDVPPAPPETPGTQKEVSIGVYRSLLAVTLGALGTLVVVVLFHVADSDWLVDHPHRLTLEVAALTFVGTCVLAVGYPRIWKWALGVAAVSLIAGIIGGGVLDRPAPTPAPNPTAPTAVTTTPG